MAMAMAYGLKPCKRRKSERCIHGHVHVCVCTMCVFHGFKSMYMTSFAVKSDCRRLIMIDHEFAIAREQLRNAKLNKCSYR